MELVESQPLLEWLANNYKSFGATLEIITDKSQEGSQFVRGFGGIGGQYQIYSHSHCNPLNTNQTTHRLALRIYIHITNLTHKNILLIKQSRTFHLTRNNKLTNQ